MKRFFISAVVCSCSLLLWNCKSDDDTNKVVDRDRQEVYTENISEIDGIIEKTSEGWSVERISTVNLSILRLSVGEMLYMKDIPAPVSVNEAVGLAKVYDGEESVAFMNGVLDKIRNSLKVM